MPDWPALLLLSFSNDSDLVHLSTHHHHHLTTSHNGRPTLTPWYFIRKAGCCFTVSWELVDLTSGELLLSIVGFQESKREKQQEIRESNEQKWVRRDIQAY